MLAGLSRLLEREVEGCNRGGRGAIEIDILEVLPGKEWYSELRQDNPQDVGGVSLNVEDALVWALRAMFNRLESRAAAHFSNRGCCYPQNLPGLWARHNNQLLQLRRRAWQMKWKRCLEAS